MIIMHGLFDVTDDATAGAFREAFDLFSEHLKAIDMVLGCRFMRHQAHDGYNSDPPLTQYYVSMEFVDMDYAQRCWDYVEENKEPLKSLHTAVFTKIQNYRFFLSSDV